MFPRISVQFLIASSCISSLMAEEFQTSLGRKGQRKREKERERERKKEREREKEKER